MREQGQRFLGWRSVPVNATTLGKTSRACMPVIRQAFIERSADIDDEEAFERKLYLIRKIAEKRLRYAPDARPGDFYAASLSCRTIVYKGMLLSRQVAQLYLDLNDLSYDTAIALVHSRYSTNTFPSWERAHPNRYTIDVYKRQVLRHGLIILIDGLVGIRPGIKLGVAIPQRAASVSYTHLDVYKRQALRTGTAVRVLCGRGRRGALAP